MLIPTNLRDEKKLLDNRYQLKKKIGGGGFAEVWLAFDVVSRIDVALKIYISATNVSQEDIEMFRVGFARICDIHDTNILHPYTFGITENVPWMAMPYCPKGTAASLIGNISEENLWNFTQQVASGLAELHKHRIIHQDIKPHNVLIDNDGKYLITDFDICTQWRNTVRTNSNELGGTTQYMAWERYPHPEVGHKETAVMASDIWALGASLFELATGDVPFGTYGGATQKSDDIPTFNREFSPEMKNLIKKCLAKETWKRPDAVEIVEMAKTREVPIDDEEEPEVEKGTDIKVDVLDPNPSPLDNKWKKYTWGGLVVAAIAGVIYIIIGGGTEEEDQERIDNAFIAQVKEVDSIVGVECEKIKGALADNLDVKPLFVAIDKYHNIDTIPEVSEQAKMKGDSIWAESMAKIQETEDTLNKKAKMFEEEYETPDIALKFSSRCDSIDNYLKKGNLLTYKKH